MQLKVQAGNRNGDDLRLWYGRRTVLNAGLQSAKSRPHRKLKIEMSLYSRSTTVIHHDSPWLIRHDTMSVRVRQSSGNRSGSGINVCTPMLSVVNPGSSWYGTITPCSNIPVKTLGRPRITKEIRTKVTTRFQSFPHQWHRSKNRQYPDM